MYDKIVTFLTGSPPAPRALNPPDGIVEPIATERITGPGGMLLIGVATVPFVIFVLMVIGRMTVPANQPEQPYQPAFSSVTGELQ
jgi:hypothetical protein